ncbi:FtsX-like permease family protein [Sinosporangium album]|uniref:FtsX-like permease family protein n=1 Tax=Sinosporangium album TaxID=504805 RepID=A0A1G7T527_9ACTN|nr:FtsX-like permease family protein [Sinosporangium album]SDG30348.1 FtsX-like permease family protein [Sinosporangium album]
MNSARLSWRLLRGGGRKGMVGAALTLAAVAVSSLLLVFAVAVNHAFDGRAERAEWRNPPAHGKAVQVTAERPKGAVAVQAVDGENLGGRVLTIVRFAVLKDGVKPPEGLRRLPKPGEVMLSPALAELIERRGTSVAGLPPAPAGSPRIGDGALVHPDELVAVVGHAPKDPEVAKARKDLSVREIPPVWIKGFDNKALDEAVAYQALATVATALMVVPLLVFGGAAARLTVARRDQRLAALRLIGATPGQVVAMTVAEAVVVAFAGSVLGAVLYGVAMPFLSRVEIGGGPWFTADLWPGLPYVLAVVLAVPLLVGVSAVVGLRRVVVSPLGVAKRETPPGMRFVRVIALLAVLAVFPALGVGVRMDVFPAMSLAVGVIAVMVGLAFLCVNLAGPWVVALIGRIVSRLARTPAMLLAGRRLVDDPRSAWRTVSGVAMTGFVAGFIGLLAPGEWALEPDDLAGVQMFADIRTGTVVVLTVSFLVAIASAGITAVSSILDRRQTYALLHLAGTPLSVLDWARRAETLIPLAVMGGGSIAAGAFAAMPFMIAGPNAAGLVPLLVSIAVGFVGVVAAGEMSRPLLRSVTLDPAPRPD